MPENISGRGLFESRKLALKQPILIDGTSHHAIALEDSQRSTVIFVNEVTLLVRRIAEAHRVTDFIGPELTTGR